MRIETISDFRQAVRQGQWAWPGGYPRYFVLSDGEALSFEAARQERRQILEALAARQAGERRAFADFLPVAVEINWEDPDVYCAHTGERIPSAYAEEPAEPPKPGSLEVLTATAPSHWASYLINGDDSGLEPEEKAAADAWIDRHQDWGMPVSCEDAGFMWRHDAYAECPLGADCQTYTFLVPVPESAT